MTNRIIVLECINGERQLPDSVKKNLKEFANRPIAYSDDCPELTATEISEFVRVADYTFDTKTKTFHPKVLKG